MELTTPHALWEICSRFWMHRYLRIRKWHKARLQTTLSKNGWFDVLIGLHHGLIVVILIVLGTLHVKWDVLILFEIGLGIYHIFRLRNIRRFAIFQICPQNCTHSFVSGASNSWVVLLPQLGLIQQVFLCLSSSWDF